MATDQVYLFFYFVVVVRSTIWRRHCVAHAEIALLETDESNRAQVRFIAKLDPAQSLVRTPDQVEYVDSENQSAVVYVSF